MPAIRGSNSKGEIMSSTLQKTAFCAIILVMVVGVAAAQSNFKPAPGAPYRCPCFTQADVEAIPMPYEQCVIDWAWPDQSMDVLTTNIIYEQGISGATAKISKEERWGYCAYIDIDDPLHTFVTFTDLSYKEGLACQQIIADVIEMNQGQCLFFCVGEDCSAPHGDD
jgi:hypothetical protein